MRFVHARGLTLSRLLLPLCFAALLSSGCAQSVRSSISNDTGTSVSAIPESIGVNIHFTDPNPGEMKMLAAAGFRWVRMDFHWQRIEIAKGQYEFAPYDRLMQTLDQYKMGALFILDYGNNYYDDGEAPYTDEARRAFARWAAASARHFRGRGILWEIYNEPNTGFWSPHPSVHDYARLALEVAKAMRAAAPEEKIIGPAVWAMDFPFLEECFKAGLLEYWSAVSVHPYRQTDPETAIEDYRRLRRLIDAYAPAGKHVPIISSEWGYTSAWRKLDESWQSAMLTRELLVNQANGIALSIWYDWRDDGLKPKEIEHHWGTVFHPYYANREPVYDIKPAYQAAQTLNTILDGYRFSQRLSLGGADDYVLEFRKGDVSRFAAWTTATAPHSILLPMTVGAYRVMAHTGELIGVRMANKTGLFLTLTEQPQYLVPEAASGP
jgi:polysaccharide biosynthesis protein PslG